MSFNKVDLRKSKEEIKNEFETLKKIKKIDKDSLEDLIFHCDVVPEIIESYLDILQKEDRDLFLKELFIYYPILPVEVCKKFNVRKIESEKDKFFNLIEKLIAIQEEKINIEKNLINFLKKEIHNCDEIKHLIPKEELEKEIKSKEEVNEITKEEKSTELKDKNELQEIEKEKDDLNQLNYKYSRWLISYNTEIDFKKEENEEFLFYHLSNNLISEFIKEQKCFSKRIELISIITDLFKEIYSKRKDGQIFSKYFEFLCLVLINAEKNKNYIEKLKPLIDSIDKEINYKYMNLEEIKKYLSDKNYKYECKDNEIKIIYKSKKFIIDDYNKYNLNANIINELLNKRRLTYKSFLEDNIKFIEHLNRMKNDLLIKIIKKYSSSNLAITSIEKLFNIEKKEYEELFKEISDNIENYIYLLPYDCFFDTERTCKNPMKVLIDPYKEKYILERKFINNNLELESLLIEFCNISIRKFCFEHEIHHLTTVLLFFLYIHEDSSINSIIKELSSNGDIIFHPEMNFEDMKKKNDINFQKEAGNIFEVLCYGNIQKEFTLKQLLFIANEKNDELDCDSFKNKYKEECLKDISQLLKEFPDGLLLSDYVKKINECIDKNPEKKAIMKSLDFKLVVKKDEVEENKDIYSILNNNKISLVTEFERYNNQLIFEKRPIYKIKKKK